MRIPVYLISPSAVLHKIAIVGIVVLLVMPLNGPFVQNAAGGSGTMTDLMLYMNSLNDLPEYCQCRLAEAKFREDFRSESSPAQMDWPVQFANIRNKWVRVFGNNWHHLHHYCFGIKGLNRSVRISGGSQELRKKAALNQAIMDFEYMRRRADRYFPLWSQLFMYESQVYMQLGQPDKAQRAMEQAAEHQKRLQSRR